jgi:hypothetical protein
MGRGVWMALVVMASMWAAFGCEGSQTVVVGACAAGQSALCLCDDGTLGSQHCGEDGAFGACECVAQTECASGDTALCLCPLDRAGRRECGPDGTYGMCDCTDHFGFCVPGEVALCSCDQGEAGVQACTEEGIFGACQCDGGLGEAGACQEGEGAFCRCVDGSPGGQVCHDGSFGPCHCPQPSAECSPGVSRTCYCTSGETGLQTCQEDGTYDACQCEPGVPRCTPGRSVACHCADGSLGVQWCQSDGVYGACACDGSWPDAGAFPDDAEPPDPCTPKTCEDLLAACGELRDGCGGAASCGTCDVTSTRVLELDARDLIFDHLRGLLYVSTPSTQGLIGNSVVAVDPTTGERRWDRFVGSEPGPMAISDDAQYLYVGLTGAKSIARLDLDAREVDLEFLVGDEETTWSPRPAHAGDIEVMPGLPGTIAVSMRRSGVSPDFAGVAIFDDGLRRPVGVRGHTGARVIVAASSTTLYGYNNSSTEYGFRRLDLTEDGVEETWVARDIIRGFQTDITIEGGLVFATDGTLVEPITPRTLGRYVITYGGFSSASRVKSEWRSNRAYFVVGSNWSTLSDIIAFDRSTFAEIGRVTVDHTGQPHAHLVRWSADGFAFLAGGDLVIVESNLGARVP